MYVLCLVVDVFLAAVGITVFVRGWKTIMHAINALFDKIESKL